MVTVNMNDKDKDCRFRLQDLSKKGMGSKLHSNNIVNSLCFYIHEYL